MAKSERVMSDSAAKYIGVISSAILGFFLGNLLGALVMSITFLVVRNVVARKDLSQLKKTILSIVIYGIGLICIVVVTFFIDLLIYNSSSNSGGAMI